MSMIVSGEYPSFPLGVDYTWRIKISVNEVAQDISGDAVNIMLKENADDDDADAVLDFDADVVTAGATGYAIFQHQKEDADYAALTERAYFLTGIWTPAGGDERTIFPAYKQVRAYIYRV